MVAKTGQEEESIDDEVRDLVRDLGGKIAAQSFGFDKEDSIPFGFSDNEDGDAEKSSKAGSRPSQDANFNKMLSENLSPAFRPSSSTPVRPNETPSSLYSNPSSTEHGQDRTGFSNPVPDVPNVIQSNSEFRKESAYRESSSDSSPMFSPASKPVEHPQATFQEHGHVSPKPTTNPLREAFPFGGLEGASETKASAESFDEDREEDDEDLDLQVNYVNNMNDVIDANERRDQRMF